MSAAGTLVHIHHRHRTLAGRRRNAFDQEIGERVLYSCSTRVSTGDDQAQRRRTAAIHIGLRVYVGAGIQESAGDGNDIRGSFDGSSQRRWQKRNSAAWCGACEWTEYARGPTAR